MGEINPKRSGGGGGGGGGEGAAKIVFVFRTMFNKLIETKNSLCESIFIYLKRGLDVFGTSKMHQSN